MKRWNADVSAPTRFLLGIDMDVAGGGKLVQCAHRVMLALNVFLKLRGLRVVGRRWEGWGIVFLQCRIGG